jgi:hypothetical protein
MNDKVKVQIYLSSMKYCVIRSSKNELAVVEAYTARC